MLVSGFRLFFGFQRARKENAKIREQLEKQKQAREREVGSYYTHIHTYCT